MNHTPKKVSQCLSLQTITYLFFFCFFFVFIWQSLVFPIWTGNDTCSQYVYRVFYHGNNENSKFVQIRSFSIWMKASQYLRYIFFIVNNPDTSVYPKKMYSDGSEKSFQPKWKQLYPWIAYNFDKDLVLCSYCAEAEKRNYFGLSTKREPAFISKGFSNWKKALEKFQIHEGSDCHNEAKQTKILAATSEPIDEHSNSKLADQKRNNRQIFLKILEN